MHYSYTSDIRYKKNNIDQKDDEVFFRWLLNFYILLLFISKHVHVYNIRMTVYN